MSVPTGLSIPAQRHSAEDLTATPPAEAPAGSVSLLLQARTCLHEAETAARPVDRFASAHVAALRAATAVLVARSRHRQRGRPASVWTLLTAAAPELREWAALFAAHSDRRAAAEAGVPVAEEVADALLDRAREFLDIVGRSLLGVAR
ncbi:SAV_6107 family HEPN domain-containing protein [Saccharopolyspora rosea]|uniref:SAV_6107 family HEPN domain-containing protein n=1 Tax=Saccharopolyspora rosea TaxID=524884 RepID=UPI0021D7E6D3|nr:SAV_6107 family HEPN domain-containing protein [Saccharopolyspora rosea]